MRFLVSDFSEEHDDIVELLGVDMYVELIKLRGGGFVYFPQYKTLVRDARNRDIIKRFNGVNAASLAKEYGITEGYVRKILRREGVL